MFKLHYDHRTSLCLRYWLLPAAEERLAALVPAGRDLRIGWFSFRGGAALNPSMREAAVTAALVQRQQQKVQPGEGQQLERQAQVQGVQHQNGPILLALLNLGDDHSKATMTLQYRWVWLSMLPWLCILLRYACMMSVLGKVMVVRD